MVESKAYKYSVYAKNIEVRWGSEIIFDGELENIGTKVWNSNRVSKHGQKKNNHISKVSFLSNLGKMVASEV